MVPPKAIDALLPQTQCGECGYAGCLPYAEAIAQGLASIDRCPPGGESAVKELASLLNIDPTPYLPTAALRTRPPALASIREEDCVGCTKCIQACPVDAIIGSGKLMHGIINHECTGCGLCIEPCPVDCIELIPLAEHRYDKSLARQRFQAKKARLQHDDQLRSQGSDERRQLAQTPDNHSIQAKKNYILDAIARVEAKKTTHE